MNTENRNNMHSQKRVAFSPNGKYFACFNADDKLLVWKTLNNVFIDCRFDSEIYTTCSSLHWISVRHKTPSPKKGRLTKTHSSENQLLAVGTVKGDILLYDVNSENLYLHLVGRHSGAVNDMCFYSETDSLFTCSSDKSIAIWDISTGKQKSKWKAGDDPVSSICVIDENNMLSSSTSIILWNISEKKAIKKFSGHSTEIFKLLPVNAVSLNSCYFLSAAVSDVKINAWSLRSNESETPVASFILPEQPIDLDISKASSKDKPLVLSAVTKDGFFHLFEHVLNGKVNQPIHPKVSLKISPKSPNPSIISLKLSPDSESVTVATGSNKDNMTFKQITYKKIKESLQESQTKNKTSVNKSQDKPPIVIETSQTEKNIPINGLKSPTKCSEKNKKTQLDSVVSSYRRKLRSSTSSDSVTCNPELVNLSETEDCKNTHDRNVKVINMKNPKSCVDILLKGINTENEELVEAVLHISDIELIRKCVEYISPDSLKLVLHEFNSRLCHHQSYTSTLSKWLKEISKVHLNHIKQNEETREVLQHITKYLDSLNIKEALHKMSVFSGILSETIQTSSSEDSNSDSDNLMEL